MAEACVPCVAFGICLIDHVQAEFIAHIEEPCIIWVVRATNSVDVVLLHQHQVGTHVVNADCFALIRVMIVTVHTPNHDALPIDQQ